MKDETALRETTEIKPQAKNVPIGDVGQVSSNKGHTGLAYRYKKLFSGKFRYNDVVGFLKDIFNRQKTVELISFLVWEIRHSLGLFTYLRFSSDVPVIPNSDWSNIERSLAAKFSLEVRKTECLKYYFVDEFGNSYGCKFIAPCDLDITLCGGQKSVFRFSSEIMSIFVSSKGIVFVCIEGGLVLSSNDTGKTFHTRLRLSDERSYFRFDYGMTETKRNELLIGEYGEVMRDGRYESTAFVYCSTDDGASWTSSDFLIRQGVNKHVHMIKYCSGIDAIVLTDGDNKKQLWKGTTKDGGRGIEYIKWKLINNHHIQTGGHMSICELEGNILFGTDYWGGTNFLIESGNCEHFAKLALPDPYRRGPILGIKKRRMKRGGNEIWAVIHEPALPGTKSLLMFTRDGGLSWIRALEYDGFKNKIHIVSASRRTQDEIYISVTSSRSGDDVGLATFRIGDFN